MDQLRRDRLDETLPGGLGRLVREGRVYTEGMLDHGITSTCPGHASLITGRHPGAVGVPGNSYIERASGEAVYCVADSPERAPVFGLPEGQGRSPVRLRATALGDWMKDAHPAGRVASVSPKDRSAILLGGQRADAAYWFEGPVGFTTSRYYRDELPEWVRSFNARLRERVPEAWEHAVSADAAGGRPDDFEAESAEHSRTSPHPIAADDFERFAGNLAATPFLDLITLDFARELLERERLGRDQAPDLLAIGLSATDSVGHEYGPESHEARDALLRLDAAFGRFLAELERELGPDAVVTALSADHGVLPLPEWLARTGRARCPVEGGRASVTRLAMGLGWQLHRRFTGLWSLPRQWIELSGTGLSVDRALAAERGVAVADVIATTERYLERNGVIRQVWTADEIRNGRDEYARLYRNSWTAERGADLILQLEPGCLLSPQDHGTSHGTPYPYDRAVPIVFHGAGIESGRVGGRARTIDVAPTLARHLGVTPPPELDGVPLF